MWCLVLKWGISLESFMAKGSLNAYQLMKNTAIESSTEQRSWQEWLFSNSRQTEVRKKYV